MHDVTIRAREQDKFACGKPFSNHGSHCSNRSMIPFTLAIPAFVIFLAIEWFAARALEDHPDDADGRARPAQGGYRSADARTSVLLGLVSIATSTFWKVLALDRLFRNLGVSRSVAPLADCLVHLGDPAARNRRPLLRVSPHRTPSSSHLGHTPGSPFERVLQFQHRTAAEVEQQR